MKRKTIAVAHSLYPPTIIGGAEISTQILAETLNHSYEVNVLTVGGHNDMKVLSERVNGISVSRLPYSNLYWYGDTSFKKNAFHKIGWRINDIYNVKQYHHALHLLKNSQVEILHTQNLPGLSLSIWKAAYDLNIPIVHTLRDFSLLSPINLEPYNKIYRLIVKKFSSYVTSIIGISNNVLENHLDAGLFKHATPYVVHNVVESSDSTESVFQAKLERMAKKEALIVGYFGQLTSIKGISLLIKAVKELPINTVAELRIYGEGPERENLTYLAGSDSRIRFLGKLQQEEITAAMAEVDVTFVPSIWKEPFGRVIIESYLVGTPVFGSDIGGIPEVIYKPESFCFQVNCEKAIKVAIENFAELDLKQRKEISQAVHNHSRRFSTKELLKKHVEIYNEIMSEKQEYL